MRTVALTSVLAVLFSLSAQAGYYPNTFNDSGPIPQGGAVFSVEQTISGIPSVITGLEFILKFNDSTSLTGDNTGIQGLLNLGTSTDSPSYSFSPTATYSDQGYRFYDVTLSYFNGDNPNNTWGLVLWDNSHSGIENGLVSWSLNITAVPEPVSLALGIFAGIVLLVVLFRSRPVRERIQRWRVAANAWIDAV